ncbi:DUF2911 domain-containing protein [Antarcticibacterium arcticum]|uniref:DUF2911 domain-containing protein n=1 Tax=Antarcticibacterium arcticum TaxID=2585771 RepID=A0A5B8YME6_9FLAO|nr:DUF2911 domain-containing protein [Antarcticibacterium arcticum]QED38914.1 DUF2911 domain-containing protein [Antarcticibacterium arcticum]
MKKLIYVAIIAFMAFPLNDINAQDKPATSPNFPKIDASPMDLVVYKDASDKVVARVIYSRPQKRDREVFGKLVPYGQVWRTGANEATELTLYKDMKVADVVVKAGTYTIYTIPEEKEWTVILNKTIHTWGAYEYTDKEDLVRIIVPVRQSPTSIEAFSMTFAPAEGGASLLMGWDNKYVEVPFKNVK